MVAGPSANDAFLPAQPGEILSGRYRIEREIATGGMGVVMAAQDLQSGTTVAIKILKPEVCRELDSVARFVREARITASLSNEHIAHVHDVGTLRTGEPFMVLEYLEGQDLGDIVDTHGALPTKDAVDFTMQTLEALAEAHSVGIIHRDIKPPNLFVASQPDGTFSIKVLDFGISKGLGLDGRADGAITKTSQLVGSPGYMSPEQLHNPREVDPRTDIWSVGVVLDELLTSERLFEGETMGQTMANILSRPIRPVRTRRPDVHEGLERIIMGCLERDVTRRFKDVGQLADALCQFASPRGQKCLANILSYVSGARVGMARGSLISAEALDSMASVPSAPALAALTPVGMVGPRPHTMGSFSGHAEARSRKNLTLAIVMGCVVGFGIAGVAYYQISGGSELDSSDTGVASAPELDDAPDDQGTDGDDDPSPAATAAAAPSGSASASAASASAEPASSVGPKAVPSAVPPVTRPQRPVTRYPKSRYPDSLLRDRD